MLCGINTKAGVITLFPNSFTDEENIVRTLVHEKTHVEQFRKYTPRARVALKDIKDIRKNDPSQTRINKGFFKGGCGIKNPLLWH